MTDFIDNLPPIVGSGFIERPPLIRAMPPHNRSFVLYEAVMYDVGHSGSGDRITVPAGFVTDFASVPRIMWAWIPPMGKWSGAAIVHDYGYVVQDRPRAEYDAIFLEAMGVLGVPWIRRHLMYLAVRIGGWLPWHKRSKNLVSA